MQVKQKRAGEHAQNAARPQGECVPQPGTRAPSDGVAAVPSALTTAGRNRGLGRGELSQFVRPTVALKHVETGSSPVSCDESRERKQACGDGAHYSCLRYLSLRLRSSFLRLRPKLWIWRAQAQPHRRRHEGQFASARTESIASILTLGCALPTG